MVSKQLTQDFLKSVHIVHSFNALAQGNKYRKH